MLTPDADLLTRAEQRDQLNDFIDAHQSDESAAYPVSPAQFSGLIDDDHLTTVEGSVVVYRPKAAASWSAVGDDGEWFVVLPSGEEVGPFLTEEAAERSISNDE